MASLNLITSNPVTDEFNAAQKRAADQETADLTNAINRQAYQQNAQLFPSKLHQVMRAADQADLTYDTDLKEQADNLLKNHNDALNSGVTVQKSQEDLRHSQIVNPLLEQGDQADLSTKQSQNRVQLGTEGSQIQDSKNRAAGSALQNEQTQLNIDAAKTNQQNNTQDRAQAQIGKRTELEEQLFIDAASDPEGAIQRGKAAGLITTPEQEDALRHPQIVGQATTLISVLRSVAPTDPAWRDAEFNVLMKEAQTNPSLLGFSGRTQLRQRILEDFNGGQNKRVDDARMRAGNLLHNSPQWQMAPIQEQQRQMDQWTNWYLNGGADPAAGSDLSQTPTATPDGSSSSEPGLGTRIWNYFTGGGQPPAQQQAPAQSQQPAAKPQGIPLPRTPDGKIDRSKLVPNTLYNMPGAGDVTFDGNAFVQ
jgi:hypothetical protein